MYVLVTITVPVRKPELYYTVLLRVLRSQALTFVLLAVLVFRF